MRLKLPLRVVAAVMILTAAVSSLQAGSLAKAACSDAPKAGVVELHPNGTANAMELVEFSQPFCHGPVVVTATVRNENTAGEQVGAQSFAVYGAAISIQLDAPSTDSYSVYWMAMRATQ